MSPFLKVSLRDIVVRRIFRAKRKPLKIMLNLLVIIYHPKAGLVIARLRPSNELVPITTHGDLPVANVMAVLGVHGRVVCSAHDILAESVQTVLVVFPRDDGFDPVLCVQGELPHVFLVWC